MKDNRLTEKNGHGTWELNESRFSVRHSGTHTWMALIDQFTVQNQSHGPLSQGPCTLVPRQ